MDLMQKLGGRKFLMALVVVGAAIFLEIKSDKGLSPTMAGFLVSIVATFSAANYAASSKFMDTKGKQDPSLHAKMDSIQDTLSSTYNKESEAALVGMLTQMHQNMNAIKDTTTQVGTAVINMNQQLQKRS